MIVRTDVHILGDTVYARGFDAMARDVDDMSTPLGMIGQDLRASVAEQFATQGARDGTPWSPLTPAYAEWKESHYPGRPILVRTGRMREALLSPSALKVDHNSMTYDPDSDIWQFHQLGTRRMVARKLLVLRPGETRGWDRYFHEWINYLKHRHLGLT